MKRLWKWFERKMLKITYSIGADFNIYDNSVIVVIRINNRTGRMEVMADNKYKKIPYRAFTEEIRGIAKRYNTKDYFIDEPINMQY